jgi:hypothetical protein
MRNEIDMFYDNFDKSKRHLKEKEINILLNRKISIERINSSFIMLLLSLFFSECMLEMICVFSI